jgi:hypothetical protein
MVAGEKRVHRIASAPRIDVFSDGTLNRIGLVMEIAPGAVLPPSISRLAFVEARLFTADGRHLIEVSTGRPALYHEFYHLAAAAAERVIIQLQDPVHALSAELDAFEALLEVRPLFGIEREIGLLGELLFLQELVSRDGPRMLDSWIGPTAEPHDFRVATNEYEVKTTLSPRRIHTINGPEQLVPSTDCTLFLVSTLLAPPGSGDGFSLSSTVTTLATTFASSRERTMKLEALLAACDLSVADAAQYTRSFMRRRPVAIVPVDARFPSITRPILQHVLGPLATRVDSFRYDVNVEGLEYEQGSAAFEEAMHIGHAR